MAKRFSIESVFKAIDRVTGPMRGMARNVNKFTSKMQRGFRSLNRTVNKLGRALKVVSIAAIASLAIMGTAMADVVMTGAEFEQTLVNAAAKFPEGIKRGTEAFNDLESVARRVGGTTEFTASQAASGLNFLAMAGFNAKQSMAALPGVVDLATAAQIDLGTASDIATDSLGAFGLATKDPIKLAANLARVNDVLALATVRTNTNMEQLFEGVVKGAPAFTAAGQSMESFTALMGVMANSGIKGGEAGTILRNTVLRLSNPVGEAAKVMRRLGVEVADSDGNFRDILDIMVDFEKGLGGLGEVQKSAALATVFGTRAVSGLNVQLKEGSTSIADFRKELIGATGKASEMASVMRDTLKGRINTMKSSFEGLKLTIFSLKQTALEGLTESITSFIRIIDTTINANKELSTELIDGLFMALKGITGIMAILLIQFVVLKAGIVATFLVTSVWSAALFVLNGALLAFNVVLGAVRLGMIAFNIIAAANPIGAIILAVVALIGLGFLLIKNWDLIVAKITSAAAIIGKVLSVVFAPFSNLIGGLTSIFKGASGLIFGSDAEAEGAEAGGAQPQVVTPQDRMARTIEEKRETGTAELTIKDETGRGEITKESSVPGVGINLQTSGAFQ